MKKISIAIIVCNLSEEIEVIVPADLWRRANIVVSLISAEKKKNLILQNGVKISCDDVLVKENLSKYSAIYLPGGKGCCDYLDEKCEKLVKYLKKNMLKKSFYLLSACASPSVIAKMGIIDKVNATVYPGYEKELKKYCNKNVVCDKNLITTKAAGTIYDFALTVISKFISKEKANKIAMQTCYKNWK